MIPPQLELAQLSVIMSLLIALVPVGTCAAWKPGP